MAGREANVKSAPTRDGWTPLRVGCHWAKGSYTVSTVATGDYARSGYILVRERRVLGEFLSWEEVQKLVAAGA